jgi:hypothetical protein
MMVDNEQFWPDKLPRGTATRRQLFSGSSQVAGTAHGSPQNVNRLTAGTLKVPGGVPQAACIKCKSILVTEKLLIKIVSSAAPRG